MGQFRVISLSLSGKGNKVFKSGEIVTEANIPEGNIPDLIAGKYIEPIGVQKVDKIVGDVIEEFDSPEKTESKLPYNEITAKELKVILGMEDSKLTKKELYALYEKLD